MDKDIFSFVVHLPGWLTVHEGKFLENAARSVREVPGVIVEIGSYVGKSTIWLTQAGERVYAVDPHEGEFSGGTSNPTKMQFLHNLSHAGVSDLVEPIIKTSKAAAIGWTETIKLLFIDGLHDETHAREDFLLWSQHLASGGIIAMHDAFCGWEGAVNVATHYILASPEFGEIGVVGSIIYGVKKKVTITGSIIKLFKKLVIDLCNSIYRNKQIPKWIQFILVHRVLKLFLLNRFIVFPQPSGKNAIRK